MPRENVPLQGLNRGKISPLALARTDLDRTKLSFEVQTNYIPRVLGSLSFRPGMEYLGATYNNLPAKHIPFVFSNDDTALIELTGGTMRVRVNDTILTRNSVSTTIHGSGFDSDITNFTKLSDPGTLPPGQVNGVAWSPDGTILAIVSDTTPYLRLYSVSGTSLTVISNPASPPAVACNAVSFSPDGTKLIIAANASPYLYAYTVSGTTFTAITAPGSPLAAANNGITFSSDGQFVTATASTSPYVKTWYISGTSFTALSAPGTTPTGNGRGVTYSIDSKTLAVSHDTSPYVTIYSIAGAATAAVFTKLSDPGTLPAGNGFGVSFNRAGTFLAVAHTTTPYVTIYGVSGTTYTKITNPASLPASDGKACHFSSDNQFLAVAHTTTPFVTIYDFVTGAPVKITNPGTLPDGNGLSVRFSRDNYLMAVGHATTQFLTLYNAYQWLDRDDSGTTSSYGSSSSAIVTGPNTLAASNAFDWSGYTIRQVISSTALAASGTRVNVTFQADAALTFQIDKAYIGEASASGDSYDFLTTPTQLTFSSGSPGFTIANGATITSDTVDYVLDATKNLVISYHIVGGNDGWGAANGTAGYSMYFAPSVDDAATVNTSGYLNNSGAYPEVAGISQINVETSGTAGYLSLVGTRYNVARRTQSVSIPPANEATEHGITLIVAQGKVSFKIGTTYRGSDLIDRSDLGVGTYSFAFTPNSSMIFIELSASTLYPTLIDSLIIDSSGDLVVANPWTTDDLSNLRWVQSADIMYVACKNKAPYKINRYNTNSWAVVQYLPEDGPFRTENLDNTITMAPSATTGTVTLTSSQAFFKSTNVGGLMKISSIGQTVSQSLTGANQFTSDIKITGTGTARDFTIDRTGTFSATITVQRSYGVTGNWVDTTTTYTTAGSVVYNDGLDDQTVYYRVGIKTGNYTSGSVVTTITTDSGSRDGTARITSYTSATVVNAIVLIPFGSTTASENWSEGTWSDRRGWPTATTIYEGRLWWSGKDRILGSVSDGYESFAQTINDSGDVGDSSSINRTIGFGPVDTINWMLPLQRLLLGGQSSELSAKSSSFDEPLTPSQFSLKVISTQGSAPLPAIQIDTGAIFVQRSGARIYQIFYDSNTYDYATTDLTVLVPEIGQPHIVALDVQRQPDTRVHCVRSDGTVGLLVFDDVENVKAWMDIETDGDIEDVVVLPGMIGSLEDRVYYTVNRVINGVTVRYVEKWAKEDECEGGSLNKQADSFKTYTGVPTTSITGAEHLEGETVVVWADGKDVGTKVVTSGAFTLAVAASNVMYGLSYEGSGQTTKLDYAAEGGTALTAKKRACKVGFILANTHRYGLKFGGRLDSDWLDDLPSVENGADVSADYIWEQYDQDSITLNGDWNTDSRVCFTSTAPRPATILAAVILVETNG